MNEQTNWRYSGSWYFCWLVERNDGPQPQWLMPGPHADWTTVAQKACWYARKEDAVVEADIATMQGIDARVCEHSAVEALSYWDAE